jgi:hypothetical protein
MLCGKQGLANIRKNKETLARGIGADVVVTVPYNLT